MGPSIVGAVRCHKTHHGQGQQRSKRLPDLRPVIKMPSAADPVERSAVVRPAGRPGHQSVCKLINPAHLRVQTEVILYVIPKQFADLGP